jgi:hypothetical protein
MYNQGQSVYSYPVIGPGTRYNQEILNDFIIIIQIMKLLFATLCTTTSGNEQKKATSITFTT